MTSSAGVTDGDGAGRSPGATGDGDTLACKCPLAAGRGRRRRSSWPQCSAVPAGAAGRFGKTPPRLQAGRRQCKSVGAELACKEVRVHTMPHPWPRTRPACSPRLPTHPPAPKPPLPPIRTYIKTHTNNMDITSLPFGHILTLLTLGGTQSAGQSLRGAWHLQHVFQLGAPCEDVCVCVWWWGGGGWLVGGAAPASQRRLLLRSPVSQLA